MASAVYFPSASRLGNRVQMTSDGAFTSAEFAVQMIESPAKVTFTAQ